MDALRTPFVRSLCSGTACDLTLPGVLAVLMADRVASFSALRAHQRHAWHAFLAQLGAMALHKAGLAEPPLDETAWRDLLLGLAPEETWRLIAPLDRPALLQPPLPDGLSALKNSIATPDALDMLVTSRNHDLKAAVIGQAQPDDWFFALLTLQTMEGFLGAGNYGISRMNGGFANRPALGVEPPGGPGAHLRRDITRLLALRGEIAARHGFAIEGGLGLVWLVPWDGTASLAPERLDPFYIEICRRVRLVEQSGTISARAGSSKVPRIVPTPGGITGDPWAPVRIEKDGSPKVLTTDAGGFGYRRMVDLMFSGGDYRPAPLQVVATSDAAEGLNLLARALVRGQGKTEGYHERRVPLSRTIRRLLGSDVLDTVAATANERVTLAGDVQRAALRPALLALFQNGPERIDLRHDASARKAEPFLSQFDRAVDLEFFPALWREVELDDGDARRAERGAWVRQLLTEARTIVAAADEAAPKSAHRRYRARVRALAEVYRAAWRNERLRPYLTEVEHDAAA